MADAELEVALAHFAYAFEQVFHHDWDYSLGAICGAGWIAHDGTFLEPKVEDEVDDWGHRGMLLIAYRELQAIMKRRGIIPARPTGAT
jgi:hypothetical protein